MEMPQKKPRAVNLFDVPPEVAAASGVKEVGLVQLTTEEELLCFKRAKGDNAKLAMELSKAALVEADGKPLQSHDGSVDTFWKDAEPRLRQLILTAYADLHSAKEDDQKDFLASRRTRVA
jgi:hypothetical protein